MKQQTSIEDVDFVEMPTIFESVADGAIRPTFQKKNVESKNFTAAAWFLSNFGAVNTEVWWGYKIGYYVLIFPLCFAVGIAIDVSMMLFRLSLYICKRLIDVAFNGITPAIKILLIAAAVIFIILFVNKIGWDGMNAAFNKIFGNYF